MRRPKLKIRRARWVAAMALLSACAPAVTPVSPNMPERVPTQTTVTATTLPEATLVVTPTSLAIESPPDGTQAEFKTDFSKHSVPYSEIFTGGPPKDGIPAIDQPKFVSVAEADQWLNPVEPVILFQIGDEVRAYPLQILIWHEIVNDLVGGVPVVVTFCPLCNTAIAFERKLEGRVLDFGTTGRLRYSNLIMYDRQTESWWQQAGGDAMAGEYTGKKLTIRPASIIAWADFKANFPSGKVLSRDTGFDRAYGRNPYYGYDDVNNPPFLYRGPKTPDVLPPVARVLTVDLNGEAVAYPYDVLKEKQVINDTVGGQNIVVLWKGGTASALDQTTVAGGRDVGAANAYSRELNGQTLTFKYDGPRIIDTETRSEWGVLGRAINGKLAGNSLMPIVTINHFWFSWAAFKPDTRIYKP